MVYSISNFKMAAKDNNLWNMVQFSQVRARALVRVLEDFDRRGRERGQGPPSC